MKRIQLFNVAPAVPAPLEFLETLARNVWWCWNSDAVELFRRIDPHLWKDADHNPLRFLASVPQQRLETLAGSEGFLQHLRDVRERFQASVVPDLENGAHARAARCVGYFSLEFGIHESIKLYSGGLGVLAGDHLKASSDLRLPLVAVGLLYRQGYFQQYLNPDGMQQEHYPENEMQYLPLRRALGPDGEPVAIDFPLPEGRVRAAVWRLDVGRVPVYLLDTNLPENSAEFRAITAQLYGGDRQTRLRQELLLGIGGYRALRALGHRVHVFHINEGHAAFVCLGQVAHLMQDRGLGFDAAVEVVRHCTLFTTHTPVPAGNENFAVDLLRPHLAALEPELRIPAADIIAMGQPDNGDGHELSMTIFGLRLSRYCNGVSELHGRVARGMWAYLWPEKPPDEIPIGHITNGVHVGSWLSADHEALYDRYLGSDWQAHPATGVAAHIGHMPDEELWRTHELCRSRLVRTARELLEHQYRAQNAPRAEVATLKSVLDHDALTIGFARRFATYKRATLLLRDPDRFAALLANQDRPVQFIFAGKAHPADQQGKELIRELVRFSKRPDVRRHMIFVENYNMHVARRLVQGVDVWLNTPRRPLEASGTSGMKAALNGGLNLSTLDGWWAEAYSPLCGWAIGDGTEYDEPEFQDTVESQALFNLLENEVIPCFYDRPAGDVPRQWTAMMKNAIKMGLGFFSSHRMLTEYNARFYRPAAADYEALLADGGAKAQALVDQHRRLKAQWRHVALSFPTPDRDLNLMHVGDTLSVSLMATLGDLRPDEVEVQLYYGPVDSRNQIVSSHSQTMASDAAVGQDARHRYRCEITCTKSGRYGFTARAVPAGANLAGIMPGFVCWADGEAG